MNESLNVYKEPLKICGKNPITGAFRDGCCNTGDNDFGSHTVCAIVDDSFLNFSKERGNDLISDNPLYGFKGLKSGDEWCLCISRWIEAYRHGVAPPIILEATHIKTLEYISLNILEKYDINYKKNS